jgi:hypothetical protein
MRLLSPSAKRFPLRIERDTDRLSQPRVRRLTAIAAVSQDACTRDHGCAAIFDPDFADETAPVTDVNIASESTATLVGKLKEVRATPRPQLSKLCTAVRTEAHRRRAVLLDNSALLPIVTRSSTHVTGRGCCPFNRNCLTCQKTGVRLRADSALRLEFSGWSLPQIRVREPLASQA